MTLFVRHGFEEVKGTVWGKSSILLLPLMANSFQALYIVSVSLQCICEQLWFITFYFHQNIKIKGSFFNLSPLFFYIISCKNVKRYFRRYLVPFMTLTEHDSTFKQPFKLSWFKFAIYCILWALRYIVWFQSLGTPLRSLSWYKSPFILIHTFYSSNLPASLTRCWNVEMHLKPFFLGQFF